MAPSPQAETTRRRILEAARGEFATAGFAATSTRAIAKRAGITQPLVHHYFGTKERLFEAVLEDAAMDYERAQQGPFSMPEGDIRFLSEGLVVLFRWLGEHPEMMRLSAWARMEGRMPPGTHAASVYERVRERMDAAIAAGVIRDGIDVDMLIAMIDAAFKGFWDRLGVYRGYPLRQGTAGLAERYLQQSMSILFHGVLTSAVLPSALVAMEEALGLRTPEGKP